jgi:phosphoserine phosphatase
MSVLCLIANPAEPALDSKIVQAIQHETGGEINWLHQRIACEIISPQEAGSAAIARQALSGRPVDVALIPHTNRRKKILVADMDSTMIDQECIDEIADAVGIKAEVAAITARAMNGELDFAEALRTRVALVKGLDRKIIEEIRRERITLAAGGRALIQTMKAYGAYCSLVSGGFTFFANYYAERIGFDEAIANTLVFDGDTLAGTVADPIVDKTTKLTRLLTLAEERSVPISQTMAVGDGANDLDMIKAAGLGVALHAKPFVAEQAAARIDHGDLTALLYLQGFNDEEVVR